MSHLLDRPPAEARPRPDAPEAHGRLRGGLAALRPRRRPSAPDAVDPVGAPRPGRPRPPADDAWSMVSTTAAMVVLVCAWLVAQLLFLGGLAQQRAQSELYDELRGQLAAATAPLGPVTPVGDPVALLSIPDLGLEQVVVEGTASGDLLAGPGHRRDTVLPGQVGTSVVMGRAATYGAPFRDIGTLRPGAAVDVVGAQGTLRLTVLGVRRAGDELPQPRPDGAARIVLVSAEGSGRLGRLAPSEVVYVDAEAEEGFTAPPGLPAAVPDPEQPMAAETTALPLLALCLAGLLALTVGVVTARRRFSRALVWVVAAPVGLAAAWASTDVLMRLLPNLL